MTEPWLNQIKDASVFTRFHQIRAIFHTYYNCILTPWANRAARLIKRSCYGASENKMLNHISSFAAKEDGAVTVDWVVLTAAVVGLAVAAYATINSGTTSLTASTDTTLSGMTVGNPVIGE